MPNSAITPSPVNWLVTPPAPRDRRADRLEVAVQKEHDVVRQLVLGHAREAAQVGEEHGQLLLAALPHVGARARRRARPRAPAAASTATSRDGRVWQASRTSGAAPTRASTRRSASLGGGRLLQPARDAHATGRAAPAAAAHRGVRDAGRAAGLEDREADAAPSPRGRVRVGDPHRAPPLQQRADAARQQHGQQRRQIGGRGIPRGSRSSRAASRGVGACAAAQHRLGPARRAGAASAPRGRRRRSPAAPAVGRSSATVKSQGAARAVPGAKAEPVVERRCTRGATRAASVDRHGGRRRSGASTH